MDMWTLLRPVWQRLLFLLLPILFFAAVCLFCANLAYVYITDYAFDAGSNWFYFIAGILLFCLAAVFAFGCFGFVRRAFSLVVFTPQGIEQRCFGKCLCFLPWDELAETGIALENWILRGGPDRCLYFADRHLDDTERASIDQAIDAFDKPKNGKLIKVTCRGLQNEDLLREYCPVPIPETQKPQDIKRDLRSYRRDRNEDGSWGEARMTCLPDAVKTLRRFKALQQENKKQRCF